MNNEDVNVVLYEKILREIITQGARLKADPENAEPSRFYIEELDKEFSDVRKTLRYFRDSDAYDFKLYRDEARDNKLFAVILEIEEEAEEPSGEEDADEGFTYSSEREKLAGKITALVSKSKAVLKTNGDISLTLTLSDSEECRAVDVIDFIKIYKKSVDEEETPLFVTLNFGDYTALGGEIDTVDNAEPEVTDDEKEPESSVDVAITKKIHKQKSKSKEELRREVEESGLPGERADTMSRLLEDAEELDKEQRGI